MDLNPLARLNSRLRDETPLSFLPPVPIAQETGNIDDSKRGGFVSQMPSGTVIALQQAPSLREESGMRSTRSQTNFGEGGQLWLSAAIIALSVFIPSVYLGSSQVGKYTNATLIAVVRITSALACSTAAGYALWLSLKNGYEENSLIASGLLSGSLLVLTHGLLTPNALYGMNSGVAVAGQLAALVHLPAFAYLLWGRGSLTRGRNWRIVSLANAGLSLLVSISLLLANNVVDPLKPKSTSTLIVITIAVIVGLLAAAHFVDLSRKFAQGRTFGIGTGLILTASVPVFFYFGGPYTAAYWWTHGLCIVGTGLAAGMIWLRSKDTQIIANVFASILTEKPMQALGVHNSPRIMELLKTLDDPSDPRVKQALQSTQLLAQVSQEQDLDPANALPTLKTMIESLEPAST